MMYSELESRYFRIDEATNYGIAVSLNNFNSTSMDLTNVKVRIAIKTTMQQPAYNDSIRIQKSIASESKLTGGLAGNGYKSLYIKMPNSYLANMANAGSAAPSGTPVYTIQVMITVSGVPSQFAFASCYWHSNLSDDSSSVSMDRTNDGSVSSAFIFSCTYTINAYSPSQADAYIGILKKMNDPNLPFEENFGKFDIYFED